MNMFTMKTVTRLLPLTAAATLLLGACQPQKFPDEDVVLTDSDSEDDSGVSEGLNGDLPTCVTDRCATVTSTVTGVTTQSSDDTDDTAGDTDTTTSGDSSTSGGDDTTGNPILCNFDLVCDEGEDVEGCLHDCGECNSDGLCDEDETPYTCPSDCAPTDCVHDEVINPFKEQCDGGDDCTDNCELRRFVFVTSETYQGDLGGLEGADDSCNKHAVAANLPGDYMAWLSDETNSPSTRLNSKDYRGLYQLPDGTPVAIGWLGLQTNLLHPINQNELGQELPTSGVWTNTNKVGKPVSLQVHCQNWTASEDVDGVIGFSNEINSHWANAGQKAPCIGTYHLYCFQAP